MTDGTNNEYMTRSPIKFIVIVRVKTDEKYRANFIKYLQKNILYITKLLR